MNRSRIVAFLVLLLSVGVPAIVFHGGIIHAMVFLAALPVAAVSLLLVLSRWRRDRVWSVSARILYLVPSIGALVSLPLGFLYRDHQIRRTIAVLTPVVEELAAAKNTSGRYPSSIEPLLDRSSVPWIVGDRIYYHSDGSTCSLGFSYSQAFIDYYDYDFVTKTWKWD